VKLHVLAFNPRTLTKAHAAGGKEAARALEATMTSTLRRHQKLPADPGNALTSNVLKTPTLKRKTISIMRLDGPRAGPLRLESIGTNTRSAQM
jgi:hypothetical protein